MAKAPGDNPENPVNPPDRNIRVLVLTGRKPELTPLLESAPGKKPEKGLFQNHPVWNLERGDKQLTMSYVGPGPEKVKSTLDKLRPLLDCDLLIIGGTAGALTDTLQPKTLFMVHAVGTIDPEDTEWFQPEPEIIRWLGEQTLDDIPATQLYSGNSPLETNQFRSGPLVSSDRPILDKNQRQNLHDQTGAIAVDMESYWIHSYLNQRIQSGPDHWAGLRVISDGLDDESSSEVREAQQPAIDILTKALLRGLFEPLEAE